MNTNTIHAFGDSFINLRHEDPHWVDSLAHRLSMPAKNHGQPGSSLGYSFHTFMMNETNIKPGDIVIFVTTGSSRIFTKDMPSSVLGVLNHWVVNIEKQNDECKKWIEKNQKDALQFIAKGYHPKINFELIKTISYLRVWSDNNPGTLVLVIRAIDDLLDNEPLRIFKQTQNFLPVLPCDSDTLSVISMDEFKNYSVPEFESRTNHLSKCNLEILVNQMQQIIVNRDVSHYNPKEYRRGFL